jgi:DNA-binding MarR family transcriptional regulator
MDGKGQFIQALREWVEVLMHRSMSSFLLFAKEQSLSMSQIGALLHLSRKGASGVSDIGDDLGVTSAAASQMLERLVQHDLVVRSEDPHDRRAKQIVLTERGHQVIRDSMEARQRWFVTLADVMSAEERELAVSALRVLTARAGKLGAGESHCWARPAPKPGAGESP